MVVMVLFVLEKNKEGPIANSKDQENEVCH